MSFGDQTAMPSVGMRRTTRVFGVVKGGDSACVLRSGRRLWPDSGDTKLRRGNEGEEWLKKPEKKNSYASPRVVAKAKQELAVVVDDTNKDDVGIVELVRQKGPCSLSEVNAGHDRFFGIVYSRKRERMGGSSSELSVEKGGSDDTKMFGLRFSRRRKDRCKLAVVVKPSCRDCDLLSCLLFFVLRHVRRFRLTLKDLSAFLLSEPICGVYASRGIQFLQVNFYVGFCSVILSWFSLYLHQHVRMNGWTLDSMHTILSFYLCLV